MNLYVTADAVGSSTGGGKVTLHESRALAELGRSLEVGTEVGTEVWQFPDAARPWGADLAAAERLAASPSLAPRRAHFYAGTFTQTIALLRERGTRVTYTAAAHDVDASREAHEQLGMAFDYPHLTDPVQWAAYLQGYLAADAVICPSPASAAIMRGYGCRRVRVIPHGYDPPDRIAPLPARFVVGYLGQPGPDKGLAYLLEAWDAWGGDHPDALLVIAGRGTLALASWVRSRCTRGSFYVRGEVDEPRDLYDACCLYVQPSVSEGFGCEVIEARAHGRPVICSQGAGASVHANHVVPSCSAAAIAGALDLWHMAWQKDPRSLAAIADPGAIRDLTWDRVRERYLTTEFGLA